MVWLYGDNKSIVKVGHIEQYSMEGHHTKQILVMQIAHIDFACSQNYSAKFIFFTVETIIKQ